MTEKTYGGKTISELREIASAAFKRPWRYTRFEVEFDHDDDCPEHDEPCETVEVESPDEYPDGQCCCQQNVILVPGLERFAETNGDLICAAVNGMEEMIDENEHLRAELVEARSTAREVAEANRDGRAAEEGYFERALSYPKRGE